MRARVSHRMRAMAGKALLQLRMRARAPHRMRAMGIACIAIDVGLGLLGTLSTHSQTGFQAMADAFRDDPDCDAAQWTNQATFGSYSVTG